MSADQTGRPYPLITGERAVSMTQALLETIPPNAPPEHRDDALMTAINALNAGIAAINGEMLTAKARRDDARLNVLRVVVTAHAVLMWAELMGEASVQMATQATAALRLARLDPNHPATDGAR